MAGEGEDLREKYELAVSALQALSKSGHIETRLFAEESIGRLIRGGTGTPFDDLRFCNQRLMNEVSAVRTVLRRIVDIVDQKSFMDAVLLISEPGDPFALGQRSMLELALREARRCLDEDDDGH